MYLELPIMVAARFPVSDKASLVINGGPYLAYGVGGKVKYKENDVEVSVDTFGEYFSFKRFDAGLGLGIGFDFGKFVISWDSELGLVDLMDDLNFKNTCFSLGVAYKF